MSCVNIVCCTIILFGLGLSKIYGDTYSHGICKGDLCLDNNYSYTETSKPDISEGFRFVNLTNNLNQKEMYFVQTSKWPLHMPADTSSSGKKLLLETLTGDDDDNNNNKLQIFSELSENATSTQSTMESYSSSTEVTESTMFSDKDIFSSTFKSTTMSSSTTKLNIPTSHAPSSSIHSSLMLYTKKNQYICFCDVQINQCDINCCCDEDCTLAHFKVFTRCIDSNIKYDNKYCYSTNFIFENNTSHEMVQNNGGLFCIVKENLKIGLNYETRAVIVTLEAFNKSLPANLYGFSYKPFPKHDFKSRNYMSGSPVWTIQNGELASFKISHSTVGFLCNADVNIKYLVDEVKSCFYQQGPESQCGSTKIEEVLHSLRDIKVLSKPDFVNISEFRNSTEICKTNICIGITSYLCQLIDNIPNCIKMEKLKNTSYIGCWNSLSHLNYQIWHNGSEGIAKMEAYLWLKKLPRISGDFLSQLVTEVKYSWVGSNKKLFTRSGNPGYLTGKPILAGRKVQNAVNGTTDKKEAIELSVDPKNWLSVLGSEKGLCSSEKRIPINFRENCQYMCSLKLRKDNFSKEKCIEIQNNIFKLLIGYDVINETKENYFNKFVATFGNSKVEEIGDWVQVLIDSFPIISSQTYFKKSHNYFSCKNIITDLYINIVYSNTGSFLAPQAKILGVSFQFGKYKDLIYYCDNLGCEDTTFQYFKLSSAVYFIDVTKPATDAFAEPLSLEAKLPHDFFYPFFSSSYRSQLLNKFVLVLWLSTSLCFF